MLSHLLRTTKKTVGRARVLRRFRETSAEHRLWLQIKNRQCANIKFRRQVPIGPFIADFLCADARLIIELDGDSHEGKEEYDRERTKFLEEHGYRVLRFENREVFEDMEEVLEKILAHVQMWQRRRGR